MLKATFRIDSIIITGLQNLNCFNFFFSEVMANVLIRNNFCESHPPYIWHWFTVCTMYLIYFFTLPSFQQKLLGMILPFWLVVPTCWKWQKLCRQFSGETFFFFSPQNKVKNKIQIFWWKIKVRFIINSL